MKRIFNAVLAVAVLVCLVPVTVQAITPYNQNFEGLIQSDIAALANDGWMVYGNVFTSGGDYLYGYGAFPAPNDGAAFCQIDMGQGGDEQGLQQMVVFSDYNNQDHANGYLIESNVFHEQTVLAGDVDTRWVFEFQAKKGNIEGTSTALAYIKTLDPGAGFATTNFVTVDMTTIPETWGGYSLALDIDAGLEGQLIQFGFSCTTTGYQSSAIFYDNLVWRVDDISSVPENLIARGLDLRQNYPNPFNPMTRIEFVLDKAGPVDLSIYDVAGRKVQTLRQGNLEAGPHFVNWNGRTQTGSAAAAGQYWYVLQTSAGQMSRSMVLIK